MEPSTQSISFTGSVQPSPGRLPLGTIAELMKDLNHSKLFHEPSLSSTTSDRLGYSFQLQVHYYGI